MFRAMPKELDFEGAFQGLRSLLKSSAPRLRIKTDTHDDFSLETEAPLHKGKRLWVAAVKKNKNYVSFHFILVYLYPDLARKLSPELKKRMQGKGCFNFTAPDPALFDELAELVRAGIDTFKKRGLPA
jgi:hypothetical protein